MWLSSPDPKEYIHRAAVDPDGNRIGKVSKVYLDDQPRMSAVGSLPRVGMDCPSIVNFIMRMRVMGKPSEKLADLTPGSAAMRSSAC